MADDELAKKLAKRLVVVDSDNDSPAEPVPAENYSEPKNAEILSACVVSEELQNKLTRRVCLNDENKVGLDQLPPIKTYQSIHVQFPEFSRKQMKHYESMFKKFDENKDNFLCLEELKKMFESLGCPQTHLGLKQLMKDVDEDQDNKINFREFLLIFRKAQSGEVSSDDCISILADSLNEIDVHEAGVKKAQQFFDAKVANLTKLNEFEAEIKQEQEEKRREMEEKKQRRLDFKSKLNAFS